MACGDQANTVSRLCSALGSAHCLLLPGHNRCAEPFRSSALCFKILCVGTMHGVGPSVSVYSIAVHSSSASGGGICVFVLFTLSYATFVIVWSVFQMRIADMMELLPAQRTCANSLSVNSRVCAKLSAPVAFFYLGWIFENGIKRGPWTDGADGGDVGDGDDNTIVTAFAKFYQIDVIPVMGTCGYIIFCSCVSLDMFIVQVGVLIRSFRSSCSVCQDW